MRLADCVAKLFCPSKPVRLIQDQASMRNVDSRIHSLRFDCCIFLFYSLSAMTFATQSPQCGREETRARNVAARPAETGTSPGVTGSPPIAKTIGIIVVAAFSQR